MKARVRVARLALSLGLAATAQLTLASTAAFVVTALERDAQAQGQKASAKSTTAQKLIDGAKERFDDAQYDESIQLLSAALLKFDITDTQRVECYRWLAYNYILVKKEDAAKSAVYKLLAIDESFTLPSSESPRFRDPFAKWKQQWNDDGKPGKVAPTETPPAAVVVKHIPASEVPHDQSIAVAGTIEDPDKRVARIVIFYRTGSTAKFIEMPASFSDGSFKANIPGSAVKPPIVEYYVQALDKGGLPIATRGDADIPLRLVVQQERESSVFSTWWFWTGTTAVVAGAVIGGILIFGKKNNNPSGPGGGTGPSTVTINIGE